MGKRRWSQWLYWFSLALAVVIVYKTLDSFNNVMNILKNILDLLMPFIIAVLIAYIFYIPARKLENVYKNSSLKFTKKYARVLSVLSIYIIATIILVTLIKFVLPSISNSVSDLLKNLPGYYTSSLEYINNLQEDSI